MSTSRAAVLAALIGGTSGGCHNDPAPHVEDDVEFVRELEVYGQAPWDPVEARTFRSVQSDGGGAGKRGRSGVVVPLIDGEPADEALSTAIETYAWRSSEPLDAGEHEFAHPDLPDEAETVTVLPYGIGEGLDREALAGRRFAMDDRTPWVPHPSLGPLLLSQFEVWIDIEQVDGDVVTFSLIVEYPSRCRAIRAQGTLSESGELTFSQANMDIATDDGPVLLRDISFRGGFLPDGSALGGTELSATMDTALLSTILFHDSGMPGDEDGLCTGWVDCYDCQGEGATCTDIRLHAAVLTDDGAIDPDEDLPSCGLDLEDAEGALVCHTDYGCSAIAVLFFGIGAALRRRGRRTEHG